MLRFSALYEALDRTTSTNAKVAALVAYFREAPPADAAWAVFFLTGRRLKRVVPSAGLRDWAQEVTGLPEWLLYECYSAAGDFGELVALALDAVPAGPPEPDVPLAEWVEERLMPLQKADLATQRSHVTRWWLGLPRGRALPPQQAPHGRVPRRRRADARRPCAGDCGGERGDDDRGAPDGRLDAIRRLVRDRDDDGGDGTGAVAALSVLPRVAS